MEGMERRRGVDGQTALEHGVLPRWINDSGGDSTIPSPEISREQSLQGTCLHDLLHGRQTWSESNSFYKRVCRICSREGIFRAVPFQNGNKNKHQSPPPSLNDSLVVVELCGGVMSKFGQPWALGLVVYSRDRGRRDLKDVFHMATLFVLTCVRGDLRGRA